MKNTIVSIAMFLLGFHMANAQFFESENYQEQESQSPGFFGNDPTPEYETDANPGGGMGNPATPAPIDDYLLLLSLLGMAIVGHYLRRKQEPIQN
ncbi:MAG TPA: hypothetical protein VL022_10130 [Moheibacter sp.]|nr:hypothetical protein [Moheibacter sp.]